MATILIIILVMKIIIENTIIVIIKTIIIVEYIPEPSSTIAPALEGSQLLSETEGLVLRVRELQLPP